VKVLFVWIMLLLPGTGDPKPALDRWIEHCAGLHPDARMQVQPGVLAVNGAPTPSLTAVCLAPAAEPTSKESA
jgi:hypothetical protein